MSDAPPPTSRRRWRAWMGRHWLLLGIAAVMLYTFPYFARIRSANELPRVYLTEAMAEHGTFAIDVGVARYGTTADVSCAHAPKGTSLEACRRQGGHYYSNKAPGSSMLALPAYFLLKGITSVVASRAPSLAETTWVSRVFTGVLPTLWLLWLLWGFLARFAPDPAQRRVVLLAYGLGSMALTYSILFISHQLSAVCIAAAWILLIQALDGERSPRWLIIAGALAGAAPLCDYQAAFAGVPILVWLIVQLWRRPGAVGILWRLTLGAAPMLAVLLIYHALCFGGPLRTGYDASTTFAHFHQQGFLGITQLRLEAFAGSTVSGDNGLITFAPWLLLALPGLVLMIVRGGTERGHAIVIAAITLIYLLFISSINFWRGGWQLGPRYITAMLPFLLPPVAVTLKSIDRIWLVRGLLWSLVLVGIVVYASSAAVYPHFPEAFGNPMRDVVLQLVLDGHVAYNAAWLFGVSGVAGLIPYALGLVILVGAVLLRGDNPRRRAASAAVAVVFAAILVANFHWFASGGPAATRAYRFVVSSMPR